MVESLRRSSTARRLALVAIAVVVAVVGAVVFAIVFLDLPNSDVPLMFELLFTSAGISLAAGGLFMWISQERSWNRLSTRLIGAHVVGILVVLINVSVTAAAMMISTHDLSLLGLLLGYSVAIAAIYSAFISAWIGDSLKTFSSAARRMAAGDLTVRVPESGERELAELGAAFNTMAGRLQAAFQRQRELEEARQGLIAAVSHDLRTPLASLRVMVEAISDGIATEPDTIRRYVKAMERETVNLGRLIDDLFEISRLDAGQVSLRLAPSAISTLVLETCESMNAQAAVRGVMLSPRVDFSIDPVLVDPDQIQRVLYNLVQNAIRHTPEDGSIVVEVLDLGPSVQVNVSDTGEGIRAEDLPHVFDRFYRGDKARTRDTGGGAGLGLAIAKRLIETHGGRIWVAQPPGGGSVFSFTLPKAPVATAATR
jgi:two-component system, OmpR family, sensor histidine kinase SaeS